jgi:Cu/Ag efflux protein CusF
MRKLMIAASAAALLGLVSAASAAEVTGTVSAVDEANHTITLDSGQTFQIANAQSTNDASKSDAVASNFKTGDKVTITYDETGGKLTATQISPAM